MAYAPKFHLLQLADDREVKSEIVEFFDGEPLLLQIEDTFPLPATHYELIIANSQAADTEPDRILVLNPDEQLRCVVRPDQISEITDGLTYHLTLRSWHEVTGFNIGFWFVRARSSVKNKPANRGSDTGPVAGTITTIEATTEISATTLIGA